MEFQKIKLVSKLNLPSDIIKKIIKDYFWYRKCFDCYQLFRPISCDDQCNSCQHWLCKEHSKRALMWGNYYRKQSNYRMCDQCCWWEIS